MIKRYNEYTTKRTINSLSIKERRIYDLLFTAMNIAKRLVATCENTTKKYVHMCAGFYVEENSDIIRHIKKDFAIRTSDAILAAISTIYSSITDCNNDIDAAIYTAVRNSARAASTYADRVATYIIKSTYPYHRITNNTTKCLQNIQSAFVVFNNSMQFKYAETTGRINNAN